MSSDQIHDDLDPIVEAARNARLRMDAVGRRIEDRDQARMKHAGKIVGKDARYHTGGMGFLARVAGIGV